MIFHDYDIRGVFGKELDTDVAELLGRSFGTYIQDSVVVARDNRSSSKPLRDALVRGLLSSGCDVLDIGLNPAPLLYFSLVYYKKAGSVMITGSHNPKEYNGFKFSKGLTVVGGSELLKLKKLIDKKTFKVGKGRISYANPSALYISFIKKLVKLDRPLKVVVDCGNSVSSLVAPRLFRELGCKVVPLYAALNSNFPNHVPNPSVPSNLRALIRKVKSVNAELGVAFDCDADRLGVVDSRGKIYFGDMLLVIFSRDLLSRKNNAKIVVEVKCSNALLDDIRNHKGIPIISKTGRSNIKAKLDETRALLGGEMSGHIFFKEDYFGYDDGLFSAAKLLSLVSRSKSISELLKGLPKYFTSKEIRLKFPESKKLETIERLKLDFKKKRRISTLDGVKIHFRDGWALVRSSNTEPELVLRFESSSRKGLSRIKNMIYSRLG